MIFRKISEDCKYAAFFLWFAAGTADNRFHDKTTNHDSRRCGLPGDGVLSRCLAAPAHTATLSRSCIGSLRIQSVLMFRSTVTEGSGSVWVVSLDVAQNSTPHAVCDEFHSGGISVSSYHQDKTFFALTKRRQPEHFCPGCHCGLCDSRSLVHQLYGM